MGRHSAPDHTTDQPTATRPYASRHATAEQRGPEHTCNPDRPGKPLPYGKPAPDICARCAQRAEERAAGIPARPAPWWVRKAEEAHSGYPTNAEIERHFGPGGPHRSGACGPVCTFGEY
jgi:hypothetical protein